MKGIIIYIILSLGLLSQAAAQKIIWVPTSGTGTYTTNVIGVTSYNNMVTFVRFTNTNPGAATININTLGPVSLRKWNGTAWVALSGSELDVNTDYRLSYDNTNGYIRVEIPGSGSGGSGTVNPGTIGQLGYYAGTGSTLSGATIGTGVLTALGINVGSAGSFITNGGNAGTPSAIGLANGTGLPESGVTNLVSDLAAKEALLTFSTGLSRSVNTITVNTTQNISTLSNLTSNGYLKTSGGTGLLGIISTIPATDGGTGQAGYTIGDILRATSSTALGKLAMGTALQQIRVNSGATDIEYFTPTPNPLGGKGDILVGDTGGTPAAVSAGSLGYQFTGGGSGSFPTWVKGVTGITDASNAATGIVGEAPTTTISTYTNYTTTATYQNLGSISLTAGDWDVTFTYSFYSNSATLTTNTDAIFLVGTATASATGSTEGISKFYVSETGLGSANHVSGSFTFRVNISSTTIYYANTQATFTAGNPQYVGSLSARRAR